MSQILLLHSESRLDCRLVEALNAHHDVLVAPITAAPSAREQAPLLVVVDCALEEDGDVPLVRRCLGEIGLTVKRLFVVPRPERRLIVQAYALGATDVFCRPFSKNRLDVIVTALLTQAKQESWSVLTSIQLSALKVSLKLFEQTHTTLASHAVEDAALAAKLVVEATRHDGLDDLLEALRGHHNYTFRHSMFVAGTLVSFADLLGFRAADVELLATGGLMHDIGKLHMPRALLDKSSTLSDAERAHMKDHPRAGALLLRQGDGWAPEIIDAALHHHERIDGRGYPDALADGALSDVARMVAIADAFSALIDKRAYKPAMPSQEAYRLMSQSVGQFDPHMLRAFEGVAQNLKPGKRLAIRSA